MVDAGREAQVEVRVDDLAGDVAHVLIADARVVFTLRRREAAAGREAERRPILVEEVFLFVAEPRVRVIEDRGPAVGRVRLAIGQHDLAHDEDAVGLGGIGVNRDGLEHAVRGVPFGLPRGTAVEAPHRELFQLGKCAEFLDLRFAPEVGHGLVTVEPDIFQFVLRHEWFVVCGFF